MEVDDGRIGSNRLNGMDDAVLLGKWATKAANMYNFSIKSGF